MTLRVEGERQHQIAELVIDVPKDESDHKRLHTNRQKSKRSGDNDGRRVEGNEGINTLSTHTYLKVKPRKRSRRLIRAGSIAAVELHSAHHHPRHEVKLKPDRKAVLKVNHSERHAVHKQKHCQRTLPQTKRQAKSKVRTRDGEQRSGFMKRQVAAYRWWSKNGP
jgi:hypothetical protein